jgi:hypothetical protein
LYPKNPIVKRLYFTKLNLSEFTHIDSIAYHNIAIKIEKMSSGLGWTWHFFPSNNMPTHLLLSLFAIVFPISEDSLCCHIVSAQKCKTPPESENQVLT